MPELPTHVRLALSGRSALALRRDMGRYINLIRLNGIRSAVEVHREGPEGPPGDLLRFAKAQLRATKENPQQSLERACALRSIRAAALDSPASGPVRAPREDDLLPLLPHRTSTSNYFPVVSLRGVQVGSIAVGKGEAAWCGPTDPDGLVDAHLSPISLHFFSLLRSLPWRQGTGTATRGVGGAFSFGKLPAERTRRLLGLYL